MQAMEDFELLKVIGRGSCGKVIKLMHFSLRGLMHARQLAAILDSLQCYLVPSIIWAIATEIMKLYCGMLKCQINNTQINDGRGPHERMLMTPVGAVKLYYFCNTL
jgi:hypothetical protein